MLNKLLGAALFLVLVCAPNACANDWRNAGQTEDELLSSCKTGVSLLQFQGAQQVLKEAQRTTGKEWSLAQGTAVETGSSKPSATLSKAEKLRKALAGMHVRNATVRKHGSGPRSLELGLFQLSEDADDDVFQAEIDFVEARRAWRQAESEEVFPAVRRVLRDGGEGWLESELQFQRYDEWGTWSPPPILGIRSAIAAALVVCLILIGVDLPWPKAPSASADALLQNKGANANFADPQEAVRGFSNLTGPNLPELQEALEKNSGLVELIDLHAEQHPDRVALRDFVDSSAVGYGQLREATRTLAQSLTKAGLGSTDVIAICLPPSPGLVVALLGCMRAGVVWLPLDIETPAARLRELSSAAGVRLALCFAGVEGRLIAADVPAWPLGPLGSVNELVQPLPRSPASPNCPPETAAIFFTSGSSGKPKGVMYSSETLLHGVLSMKRLCRMDASSVALLKTPTIWAVIEYEVFPVLVAGGSLVCDARCQKDLQRLSEAVAHNGVTTLMTSAPVMKALVEGTWFQNSELLASAAASLGHVVNVGGAAPLDILALTQAALPQTSFHNVYGCTECTCTEWTYSSKISAEAGNAPAGFPQPEVEVFVVDSDLQCVKTGEVGEICFGSRFNSLGYVGDKELTSTKFVPNPAKPAQLLYKTGDLGCLVPDRNDGPGLVLEVTGRADRQLNISGVRVAPEEVEASILSVDGVAEVAVVQGGKSIVAFISGSGPDLVDKVQQHCVNHLMPSQRPALLLPQQLPKLQNGKVDLRTLSARAEEAAGESIVQATDSLGLMKSVNKDALRELNAFAATRCLSMLGVMWFHWFWWDYTQEMSSNMVALSFRKTAPSWVRWFVRGAVQSQWCMNSFVLMAARTDRQAVEEGKPGQLREVAIVFFLNIVSYMYIPLIVQTMHGVLGNNIIFQRGDGNDRWYLGFWLMCRFWSTFILMPIERRLQRLGTAGHVLRAALVVVSFVYSEYHGQYGCILEWGMQTDSWVFWSLVSPPHICALERPDDYFRPWLFFLYITSWFYSKPLSSAAWKWWPKALGPALSGSMFLAILVVIGWYDEKMEPMWIWRIGKRMDVEIANDAVIACLLLMTVYMISSGPWLHRLGLVYMGNYSLGTYMFHMAFLTWSIKMQEKGTWFGINDHLLPHITDAFVSARSWAGGVGQLFVLFAYPVAFSLTLGPLYQKVYLWVFLRAEKGLTRLVQLPLARK